MSDSITIPLIEASVSWDIVKLTFFLGLTGVSLAAFVLELLPGVVGSIALGLLAGQACASILHSPEVRHEVETVEKETEGVIPYAEWPDNCWVCSDEIPDDMNKRGQFAVHRSEDTSETKSIPLCETCTRTYSTLIENHEALVQVYDDRPTGDEDSHSVSVGHGRDWDDPRAGSNTVETAKNDD